MLDVRRIAAVFACVGLMAFPAAAGAQQTQDQDRKQQEQAVEKQHPQQGGNGEAAAEPAREPVEEPRGPRPQAVPAEAEPAEEPGEKPARKPEEAAEKPAADKARLYEEAEKTWITLTGTVAEANRDSFTLDYGEGLITVELDGEAWFDDATRIMPGERVRVYGEVDEDLYDRQSITADSLYIFERQSFYFGDTVGEEAVYFLTSIPAELPEGTWVSVSGIVTEVSGREFIIDAGVREIEVDTDELGYNPLDEVGLQRISVGDRVYVSGTLDDDFFEDQEILAKTVLTLSPGVTLLREE